MDGLRWMDSVDGWIDGLRVEGGEGGLTSREIWILRTIWIDREREIFLKPKGTTEIDGQI